MLFADSETTPDWTAILTLVGGAFAALLVYLGKKNRDGVIREKGEAETKATEETNRANELMRLVDSREKTTNEQFTRWKILFDEIREEKDRLQEEWSIERSKLVAELIEARKNIAELKK